MLKIANPSSSWTLLGDMNQRRSDWSYSSWAHIARDLGIVDEGKPFQPTTFERGYRSTAPIITFANRLLPRHERKAECVQSDGPPPMVISTRPDGLVSEVISQAIRLCDKYPGGTTAVIATDFRDIGMGLLAAGWLQDAQDRRIRLKDEWKIHLLTPDMARGLEFDAVVVVEPASFPANLGRIGSLYTSLTRANRELAVVHSRPLPDALR